MLACRTPITAVGRAHAQIDDRPDFWQTAFIQHGLVHINNGDPTDLVGRQNTKLDRGDFVHCLQKFEQNEISLHGRSAKFNSV